MQQVYDQTGIMPPELDLPELPQQVLYIWNSFISIGPCQQNINQEILSWIELTGQRLNPKEVEIIKKLNNLYYRVIHG